MGRQKIGRKGQGLEENFQLIVAFDGGLFHLGCCSKWRLGNRPSSAGQPRSQSGAEPATSPSLRSDGNPLAPVEAAVAPVVAKMMPPVQKERRPKRGKSKNGLG